MMAPIIRSCRGVALPGVLPAVLAVLVLCGWTGLQAHAQGAQDCAKVHEVEITHQFGPKGLVIEVGDCVRFTNIHSIEHSAVGLQREFNTGTLMPGGTSLIPFKKPMAVPYWCGLHPPMMGNIFVKPGDS